MGHHKHLTLEQREMVMAFHAQGKTITEIAEEIGKDKSTISRELRRNLNTGAGTSPAPPSTSTSNGRRAATGS